jgi:hypothetical protein
MEPGQMAEQAVLSASAHVRNAKVMENRCQCNEDIRRRKGGLTAEQSGHLTMQQPYLAYQKAQIVGRSRYSSHNHPKQPTQEYFYAQYQNKH